MWDEDLSDEDYIEKVYKRREGKKNCAGYTVIFFLLVALIGGSIWSNNIYYSDAATIARQTATIKQNRMIAMKAARDAGVKSGTLICYATEYGRSSMGGSATALSYNCEEMK